MPDFDRLINAIDAEEEDSYSSDENGDLANERARNIDMYVGKNTIPYNEGTSGVKDSTVYETIEWIKPSLARIFANGDGVVKLPPIGREDEAGSQQESEYLNYIVLQKNNWFQIFDTASTDALLTKAGYMYPYIEKRRQIEVEKYERQTPESLALIMQDQPEVVSQEEYPDPDYVPQPMMMQTSQGPMPVIDVETGQPAMQPPPMLYNVEIRRTKVETQYCIDTLPPERCKVSKSCKTVQLRDCPYFEYYDFPTISSLRNDGLDVPDDISDIDDEEDTTEAASRDLYGVSGDRADSNRVDPSMRRVKCRYIWIRHDYDEDGLAELQYVIRVGSNVLHREECNRIPVAVLCPNPHPHRHIGSCPADAVSELQDISTIILRQGINNLYLANNPQKFGDGTMVNLDDMMVSRTGGIWRTRGGAIMGQHFGVVPIPNVFPDAITGLEYISNLRQKRVGVDMSFQGLDANQLSQLQPGTVNQISSMAAQRIEQIARHYANGIEELFSILHEIILKSGHKKETVKLRGQWVDVDPATWRSRTDFRISVGYSAGNKDSQLARLTSMAAMQKEAMLGGLRICTEENVYNTAIEYSKAADFPTPERFWTDPKTLPPPPPPQPDPTVVAMEQIKTQSAERIKGAEIEQKNYECSKDNEVEVFKARLESETKLAIANAQAQQAKELEAQKGEQAAGIEQIKATLNPKTKEADAKASEVKQKDVLIDQFMQSQQRQTEAIAAMFEQMLQALKSLNGPKRIVRDRAGKAMGTEPVQ